MRWTRFRASVQWSVPVRGSCLSDGTPKRGRNLRPTTGAAAAAREVKTPRNRYKVLRQLFKFRSFVHIDIQTRTSRATQCITSSRRSSIGARRYSVFARSDGIFSCHPQATTRAQTSLTRSQSSKLAFKFKSHTGHSVGTRICRTRNDIDMLFAQGISHVSQQA